MKLNWIKVLCISSEFGNLIKSISFSENSVNSELLNEKSWNTFKTFVNFIKSIIYFWNIIFGLVCFYSNSSENFKCRNNQRKIYLFVFIWQFFSLKQCAFFIWIERKSNFWRYFTFNRLLDGCSKTLTSWNTLQKLLSFKKRIIWYVNIILVVLLFLQWVIGKF